MDPMQNPQVQQMLMALMQKQGGGVTPMTQPAQQPDMNQQASLGNAPMAAGMLNQAPPMTPPPAPMY